MAKSFEFTQAEKDAIKKAVGDAESKTSGEIVPYFVAASDEYESTQYRVAIMFMFLGLISAAALSFSWNLPFPITIWEVAVFVLLLGFIGFLMAKFIEPLKRRLTDKDLMLSRVEQSAMNAFLTEEVFNTENRTGILIFVSHFEHMVEVIGDSGINAKVNQEDWQSVIALIIEGIKSGRPAEGIINGITHCGELLEKAGVNKPAGNANELSDDIRLG